MKSQLRILLLLFMAITTQAQIELLKDSKTGKWGFTDENGEWVIPPQFEAGEDFFDYDFTFVKKGGKWGVINRKGECVLPFVYEKPRYGDYEESLRPVVKNKKNGMVSTKLGVELIACQYDERLGYNEDIYINNKMQILAIKTKKTGVIDSVGTVLIPLEYDVAERPFEFLEIGLIATTQNKKAGMLDRTGKLVVPFQYDQVFPYLEMDTTLFDVQRKGKYGLYSREKKAEIVPVVYDDRIFFEDGGFALVSRKKKYGVIDNSGKEVVPCTLTITQATEELEKLVQDK
jgi:hypothetical protein